LDVSVNSKGLAHGWVATCCSKAVQNTLPFIPLTSMSIFDIL